MTDLLLRRLFQTIPLIVGLAILNFMLIHLAPGDPATYLVGEAGSDPARIAEMRERLGLDRPLAEQLGSYLLSLAQGDLGTSFYFSRPVLGLVLERVPATLLLMGSQLIIAIAVGLTLGVIAATRWNTGLDRLVSIFAVLGFSVPVFWSGQIAILVFAVQIGLFPAQGMTSVRESYGGLQLAADVVGHLALPALTLALVHVALLARVTRVGMLDVLRREYVTVARAKGLTERMILWQHALPNAMLPIVTVIGLYLGQMLAGTVVIETVFGWPGMGRLMFDSIARRDYPVIMGGFLIVAVGITVANFITDVAYATVDPRVRLRARPA